MTNYERNINSPISNGKIDVIEMKRRSKPGANNVDCMASSSFKNVELTDDTENIVNDSSDNDNTFGGNDFVELPPINGRDPHRHSHLARPEPALVLLFQVLFPFLIAGLGMVFAGLVFDQVQHWAFYKEVPQALILVPALLGLKGNLEMTLASRLSTQSNTGKLDSLQEVFESYLLHFRNNSLLLGIFYRHRKCCIDRSTSHCCDAAAMALSWIPRGQLDWEHATLLGAAAVSTASFASLFLSLVMIAVIMAAKRWDVNPDNIATPIAASLGDLTTLTILSVFGSVFLSAHRTQHWLNMCIILLFIFILPICVAIASRDSSARQVLKYGWSPIVFSMMISSSGGFVLERAVMNFQQMPLYQPVMNGVGGNLAAVAASKLSTFYHRSSSLGILPNGWSIKRFYSFSRAFFSSDEDDSRSARVFLMLCVPGHIFFNWVISALHVHTGQYVQGSLFTALYLSAALAQKLIQRPRHAHTV
uniref:Divalent cation transporter n=1 Tax=Meloidogyne hapla TaxID=6305 RepID=A0A1I8BDE7_MELHA